MEDVSTRPAEIIFEVTEAWEGGYHARALGYNVFTQEDDWHDLKTMTRDAVLCHFDEDDVPRGTRLRLFREETIAVRSCPVASQGATAGNHRDTGEK